VENIGEFIARHRKLSGFSSQRQLADKSGISSATISRIEKNIQKPNVETLKSLSKYLKSTSYKELMLSAGYWTETHDAEVLGEIYSQQIKDEEYIINLVKLIVDDEGKVPSEYHGEFFNIFGGYTEDVYRYRWSEFDSTDEFNVWYGNEYVKIPVDQLTESDIDLAVKEFNIYYNYGTIKKGIQNLDKNFVHINKSLDDFIEELEFFCDKHRIKRTQPLDNEKEFISNLELTDDKLLEQFKLQLDGKPLTKDEAKGVIAYLRSLRQFEK
jgi:transcriptional regulator with XRE-family HTH domain